MPDTNHSERIAEITSEAIRVSGEHVIKDIVEAVEKVEHTARTLRIEADALIEEIRGKAYRFADKVSRYVTNCQEVMDLFQAQQVREFDPDNFLEEKSHEVPLMLTEKDLVNGE